MFPTQAQAHSPNWVFWGVQDHQVHGPEGWVHWASIKIEAQVHHFVTILDHKEKSKYAAINLFSNTT